MKVIFYNFDLQPAPGKPTQLTQSAIPSGTKRHQYHNWSRCGCHDVMISCNMMREQVESYPVPIIYMYANIYIYMYSHDILGLT